MIIRVHSAGRHRPFVISGLVTEDTFDASEEALAIVGVLYKNLPNSTVQEVANYLSIMLNQKRSSDERADFREQMTQAIKECEI